MMTTRPHRRLWWLLAVLAGVAVLVAYWATDDYVPTEADLRWWGDVALYSIAPPLIAFVLLYATRSRWWVSEAGRSILYFAGSLLLLLVLVLLPQFLGSDYPGRAYVRIAGFLIVFITVCRLLVALIRAQRRRTPSPPA